MKSRRMTFLPTRSANLNGWLLTKPDGSTISMYGPSLRSSGSAAVDWLVPKRSCRNDPAGFVAGAVEVDVVDVAVVGVPVAVPAWSLIIEPWPFGPILP